MKINLKEMIAKVVAQFTGVVETMIKPAVELELKKQIAEHSDENVEMVLTAIKAAIPGAFDDAAINAKKDEIKAMVKKRALELADQISDKV